MTRADTQTRIRPATVVVLGALSAFGPLSLNLYLYLYLYLPGLPQLADDAGPAPPPPS